MGRDHRGQRFSPGDTNLVLREFEKCGEILKHVPGPRDGNWMHILYQNRSDAHKALNKNGMQINGVLIVGVKLLDPMQRQALNERLNNQGFMPLPLPSARNSEVSTLKAPSRPYYLQNGNTTARQTGGTIASPTKSLVSKIIDLISVHVDVNLIIVQALQNTSVNGIWKCGSIITRGCFPCILGAVLGVFATCTTADMLAVSIAFLDDEIYIFPSNKALSYNW
ncbi:Nuclear pore complex protein NUP35, partial [Mucuna pruriens]